MAQPQPSVSLKIGGVSATVVSATSAPRQAGILLLSGETTILTEGGVASPLAGSDTPA